MHLSSKYTPAEDEEYFIDEPIRMTASDTGLTLATAILPTASLLDETPPRDHELLLGSYPKLF